MIRKLIAIAFLTIAPLASAAAQEPALKNVFTIQPLSAVFQFYSAEYERAASKATTWGLGANYWSFGDSGDELRYTSAEVKLRYYPNGMALHGFSLGGSLGYTNVKNDNTAGPAESVGGPSLGVLLEYQWLLGDKKNFAIALGAGAKALFIGEHNFAGNNDFIARYPTLRISTGWAF